MGLKPISVTEILGKDVAPVHLSGKETLFIYHVTIWLKLIKHVTIPGKTVGGLTNHQPGGDAWKGAAKRTGPWVNFKRSVAEVEVRFSAWWKHGEHIGKIIITMYCQHMFCFFCFVFVSMIMLCRLLKREPFQVCQMGGNAKLSGSPLQQINRWPCFSHCNSTRFVCREIMLNC